MTLSVIIMMTTSTQIQSIKASILCITSTSNKMVINDIYTHNLHHNVDFSKDTKIYCIETIYIMPDWFYKSAPIYPAFIREIELQINPERLCHYIKKYGLIQPSWYIEIYDSKCKSEKFPLNFIANDIKNRLIRIPINKEISGTCTIELDFIDNNKIENTDMQLFANVSFDTVELFDGDISIQDIFSGIIFKIFGTTIS